MSVLEQEKAKRQKNQGKIRMAVLSILLLVVISIFLFILSNG
jgi:cell division protein FtsB